MTSAQLEELDYRKLYAAYSSRGRKSVADPRVLFKVMAYGYQCGIYSSRKLEEACKYRVDFMWLLENGKAPDHAMVIENNLQYTKKTGIYLGPTKTGKVRALKLAPQCVELLKEWKLEQMRMRLKQGSDWKETGMVFTKDNGEWLHPDSITRWLNNFSRDNGLPHIHPHAFRHTAASTMIANGVDLVTTANELGHANATTTAMIYAHQIAIAKARAADVRAGVFAGRDSKPKGSKLRSKFRGA